MKDFHNFQSSISEPFPKGQILDFSKLKEFADDNFIFDDWLVNLVVLGFNATLTAKGISALSVRHDIYYMFPDFLSSTNTTFLSKAINYFSHMFLQR